MICQLTQTSMMVSCLGAKFFSTSSLSLRNIIGFKMDCSFWTYGQKVENAHSHKEKQNNA